MPSIKIEYDMPEGTNRDEIADFVVDALESWGGQFHPDDPLFESLRYRIKSIVINNKQYRHLLRTE
jgi:hypothetical protein